MNLEQIVKETVAKVVAEKKGKDLTGDGKIDSADYLKARSNAIEKNKKLDEDYEVAMAQDSLDSIIRAAMMLKTQMGDREVNLPAWIQDHITNSENYINQAAKGYHESDAQMDDNAGAEEMNEEESEHSKEATKKLDASLKNFLKNIYKNTPKDKIPEKYRAILDNLDEARFEKGEDVGEKGKNFAKIAKSASKQYGSKEAGQRVAGAVLKKVLNKEDKLEEDMDNNQSTAQKVAQKYGDQLTPIRDKYRASSKEWSQALSQYGANSPEFKEVNKAHSEIAKGFKNMALNAAAKEMKADGMSDTQIRNYFSEYGPFEDWVHDYMDELIDALDGSQSNESQELDEFIVRRWQHYAGIK